MFVSLIFENIQIVEITYLLIYNRGTSYRLKLLYSRYQMNLDVCRKVVVHEVIPFSVAIADLKK